MRRRGEAIGHGNRADTDPRRWGSEAGFRVPTFAARSASRLMPRLECIDWGYSWPTLQSVFVMTGAMQFASVTTMFDFPRRTVGIHSSTTSRYPEGARNQPAGAANLVAVLLRP